MSRVSSSLNFAYNMEQFAAQVYLVQKQAFVGTDVADRLQAASLNEKTHIDMLRTQMLELKMRPSRLGFIFRFTAVIFGAFTVLFGKPFVMRVDISLENGAVGDYGNNLKKLKYDEKTVAVVNQIISDEEIHINN